MYKHFQYMKSNIISDKKGDDSFIGAAELYH